MTEPAEYPLEEPPKPDLETELARLMRRSLAGEASRYMLLLERVGAMVRVSLRHKTAGTMAAGLEDIVQEVLLAVHLKRHTYNVEQPFLPWVRAIARYKWIDALRRRGSKPDVSYEDLLLTEDAALAAPEIDQTSSYDVQKLIARLPLRQQQAIELVKLKGMSVQEAADASGQSLSAIKVNIHRGIAALAAYVKRSA